MLLLLVGGNTIALNNSMLANYNTYGHKTVSSKDHPVRPGDGSMRFEERAGWSWTEE
jgi:hypothetical protein